MQTLDGNLVGSAAATAPPLQQSHAHREFSSRCVPRVLPRRDGLPIFMRYIHLFFCHVRPLPSLMAWRLPAFFLCVLLQALAANAQARDMSAALSLSNIRSTLIRLEDTIIFNFIERAQFAKNDAVYTSEAIPVPGGCPSLHKKCSHKVSGAVQMCQFDNQRKSISSVGVLTCFRL